MTLLLLFGGKAAAVVLPTPVTTISTSGGVASLASSGGLPSLMTSGGLAYLGAPSDYFVNLHLLMWAPPQPVSPLVIQVPAGGGSYGSSGSPIADEDTDVTFVLPMSSGSSVRTPMTGPLDFYGGRNVYMVGGVCQPTSGIGNFVIRGRQIAGSVLAEGIEFPDQFASGGAPDIYNFCGDWSGGPTQGFAPDIRILNNRCLDIVASNSTNHADFFQPQGVIGRLYVDKLTVSSNYDVFTIAADSCNDVAPLGAYINRANTWYQAQNATNPFTAHFWFNSANNAANHDTAPFPITLTDVYTDASRATATGGGRVQFADSAVYPNVGRTAGGGTLLNLATASPFTFGEAIGASRSVAIHQQGYAYFADPLMQISGIVQCSSPDASRLDVTVDTDGLGSFVPAGIGTNYVSPGYQ